MRMQKILGGGGMKSTKSWGGGYSLFNCLGGGGGKLCLSWGGRVRKSTNFI